MKEYIEKWTAAECSYPLIIAGPTAIGKSALAQRIAEDVGGVVVSADSMLVYKGMDIGTAKPSLEERNGVPYLGLDCVLAGEPFSVGDWLVMVREQLFDLPIGTPIIVTGGTGLYIKALLNGLDTSPSNPELRDRYTKLFESEGIDALKEEVRAQNLPLPDGDWENPRRLIRALEKGRGECAEIIPPVFSSATPIYCLTMERERLWERIHTRVEAMFGQGLVEEALSLSLSHTALGAIGYKEALAYSKGEISYFDAVEQISARTRRLAKRQITFFRHQLEVMWVNV